MDNFDLKKFISEKTLLNENTPGYSTRKQGEALPTLESVKAAYEAKNNIKENLAGRAEELEMDFMDPRNKFGDEWQEEVSNVLVRKYDGHWENWESENPDELEMLLTKFKNLLAEDMSYEAKNDIKETLVDADQDMAEAILNALGGEAAFEAVVRAMSTDDAQIYLGGIIRDHSIGMEELGGFEKYDDEMFESKRK